MTKGEFVGTPKVAGGAARLADLSSLFKTKADNRNGLFY